MAVLLMLAGDYYCILIITKPVHPNIKPTGSDLLRHTKLINEEYENFPNKCVDKTIGAFTAQPLISELDCDRVGDNVNALVNTLPALIVHELTHWRQIGEPVIGAQIIDHCPAGYGPLNCRKIVGTSITPVMNADSYAWFANEYYWSISCKKEYKDPTTNRNYGLCPVDEDATGGARCTVQ
ncbi:hypothetical protein EDB81DRAFT_762008 [Dactylonectria macrodidyma]|uniref:Lysine-specific metallo-endopeptidase domain-containing protein n=1 Tax=Dactylonectria macrodidyma TaxID=307937 RepID=A0A9P9EDH7_9HYPO|nr:hypothetical protein EDB81DRAFT_762008 [Dactylonectria macrodidyma]